MSTVLALSGRAHVFCSGMYLKTRPMHWRAGLLAPDYQHPSSLVERVHTWFLLIFSIYYCGRQLLWKCTTESLLSQPLPLHWQIPGSSFLEHRGPQASLSVENYCHCQCHRENTQTHTNRGVKGAQHWTGMGASSKWKTQQRRRGKLARLCRVESDSPSPSSNIHVC